MLMTCQAATFDLNAKKFEQLRQRLEQDGMKFSLPKCCLYMPFADLETVKVCATQIGNCELSRAKGLRSLVCRYL